MAEHIEFAGDFKLDNIVIHNHDDTLAVDIKGLVVEFNIYESMFSNALTGSLVISDSTNLISKLPIQGTERLTFKLRTPGSSNIDCTEESGHPMHVFSVTDKQQDGDTKEIYTLHFASREFLRNIRTRVSQAYSGRMDQMVASIVGDENYLDSRKTLNVQKTRNQDKIVIPNKHPFSAIKMIQDRAMADDSNSVGYFFYETPRGFHFRSWESMCVDSRGNPRVAKQSFEHMPVNMTDESAYQGNPHKDKITHEYQGVEDYKFLNSSHDVAAMQAAGTYGHRVDDVIKSLGTDFIEYIQTEHPSKMKNLGEICYEVNFPRWREHIFANISALRRCLAAIFRLTGCLCVEVNVKHLMFPPEAFHNARYMYEVYFPGGVSTFLQILPFHLEMPALCL